MRRVANSIEIGSASFHAFGSGSSGRSDGVYVSASPRPASVFSTRRRSRWLARQRAEHRLPRRKREGNVLEPRSRDLLDDVDLARDVPSAERRRDDFTVATLEAEPLEPARLLAWRSLDSDDLVRALGPIGDDGPLREVALHVDVPDPLGAGRLDDQLRRELRRLVGEVRVDAFLPAVRALGPQAEALGSAVDPGRLEVRRLEEHLGRRLADLGLLAAHDPGDRDRPLGVRDHEVALLQLALDPVERLDHLRGPRTPDDDLSARERLDVEGVERVPQCEHDVVRRVDDVRDRAHARVEQARLQPDRRLADLHVAEEPPDVAGTALEVVDRDVDRLVTGRLRVDARRLRELELVERRNLARNAVDREEIGSVARRLDEQHLLDERKHVAERRPGLGLGEDHDPGVVGAELDLVLGEDHPVRELATDLPLLELEPAGEHRPGQRNGHGRSGAEVPRSADDLPRLALPHVDPAQLQPVSVRMLRRLEHLADPEEPEVAVLVGDAAPLDALDLGCRDREPRRQLLERHLDGDVVPQPGDRDSQNCLSTRRSPSQRGRMSGK